MNLYCCPVCGGALQSDGHSLRCGRRHTFDLASSGYVNLITGGRPGAAPGDSKEMCAARNQFLSKDYYRCLADGLSGYLAARLEPEPVVVDAACGEGYYTAALYRGLSQAGLRPTVAGVDLSKHALKYAAKRCGEISFAAASIFEMPLPDGCADAVTNLFAPVAEEEFRRVLRPGGLLVIVGPGERHLWELKEFLYEQPYPNERKRYELPGFTAAERMRFEARIHLPCGEDVRNLFAMTPYYWKTPHEAARRLEQVTELDVQVAFELYAFRRTGNES